MGKYFNEAVKIIKEKYGQNAIMRLGDNEIVRCPAISTGCLSIDIASGIGGIPRGRISEVYGAPHGGKTTLALQTAVQAQKAGGIVAYIDAESAFDKLYAEQLGLDVNQLYIAQPESGEEALTIAQTLIMSGDVALVVIDSVDALVPQAFIEGDIGMSLPAAQARLMSQACRVLKTVVRKAGASLLFINQVRMNLGGMGGFGGQPTEVTSGGKALPFYTSMRIDVRRSSFITDGQDQKIGQKVKIEFKKNKVAIPYKKCEVDLIFGQGFDPNLDLIDLATSCGVVAKAGAWYSHGSQRLGQGRMFSATFLKENPEIAAKIAESVRVKKGLDILPEEPEEENEDVEDDE